MRAQTISEPQGPTGLQRARLDGTPVTLNGQPATLRNAPESPFAVVECDVTRRRVAYGWCTAVAILAAGGAYVTQGTHWPPAPVPAEQERRLPPGYADLYARARTRP